MAEHARPSKILFLLVLSLLVFAPLAAEAADGISPASPPCPPRANTGEAVIITVTGQDAHTLWGAWTSTSGKSGCLTRPSRVPSPLPPQRSNTRPPELRPSQPTRSTNARGQASADLSGERPAGGGTIDDLCQKTNCGEFIDCDQPRSNRLLSVHLEHHVGADRRRSRAPGWELEPGSYGLRA